MTETKNIWSMLRGLGIETEADFLDAYNKLHTLDISMFTESEKGDGLIERGEKHYH